MDGHTAVGLISEVFTWFGLGLGTVLLGIGLILGSVRKRWIQVDGVIATGPKGNIVRWLDDDHDVHEAPASTAEALRAQVGDDIPLWFNHRAPWICRTREPEIDGRTFRLIGWLLLGIGIVAAIVGIAIQFIEFG
ncbi:hypothetical protein ALI44B_13740 [Leifsonia sp. ALI-44-B]|uniref:hypothetical protein n=1 Tax=Leifsonia sp. ALI-44-B TaxID=1933776 RepID=UPI00097BF3A5|nr:hypothetical protein [Leifsonia sp. ALI-44-B]ONI61470.1 hypothetical protein ALI44B_13740 [Leifsonia sp. ALI-44-B]